MYLIDQKTKAIMERCKEVAREHGLVFTNESLEYITTNRDLNNLSPKVMIPTLYDYWVHDVNVIKGNKIYDIFPHNPYETVINTRPPISFYNDNNHDWLNCMIFYHVLGHIDFFQNNHFYERTWDDDFLGKSLANKRKINEIREKLGSEKRWVDYIIEFTRGVDNLVGFHSDLRSSDTKKFKKEDSKLEFYFGEFLREQKDLKISQFYEDVSRHKNLIQEHGQEKGDKFFLEEIKYKYPEFENVYKRKFEDDFEKDPVDIIEYIIQNATYLKQKKYSWIKDVMRIVRETSLYFQPQIITKIMNEGWASYWHQHLFEKDQNVNGHFVDYARTNAHVMQVPKRGLNPYAIGYLLYEYIYELANSGKLTHEFEKINEIEKRKNFKNNQTDNNDIGLETIFNIRKYFDDFTFINFLDKKNFQEFVDKNKLFVTEKRLSIGSNFNLKWEHYIKSKNGEDYRKMLKSSLYHPPYIKIENEATTSSVLRLNHVFEGKSLVKEYIPQVLIGLEQLWNGPVLLETTEFEFDDIPSIIKYLSGEKLTSDELKKKRVRYRADNKKVNKST